MLECNKSSSNINNFLQTRWRLQARPLLQPSLVPDDNPLIKAIRANNVDLVKSLLDSGADAKATGNNGYTPLMIAVIHDNDKLVKLLLPKSDAKGQLISKCPFGVFKSTKKTNKIFVRISALAF